MKNICYSSPMKFPIRINKYLAEKNVATRREADGLIERGLVTINGKKAVLGDQVIAKDKVAVNGVQIKNSDSSKEVHEATGKKYVYYAYNKPLNVVTSLPNPGEKEIKDVATFPQEVFPIGRLDKDSTGLIIMTNDGRITDKLLNPKSNHEKEYSVSVNRPINNTFLKFMKEGVRMGPTVTKPAKVRKTTEQTLDIVLTEGKNRQIRRMCKSLGFEVTKLKRIRIMNIQITNLKEGSFREITGKELEDFLKLMGI
jgi:23S rRNA pseudouridine2604 synthase